MTQERVPPHEQSLCLAEQPRQSQCSHQIHFRCCTSRRRSAKIQRRIAVRDTLPRWQRNGRPAMGRPAHPRSVFGLPASAGSAEAAGEHADQPDDRKHDGDDEQPVHDEADTERDQREDRKQNQEQHLDPPSTRVRFPFETPKRESVVAGYGRTLTSVDAAEEFSPAERERARAYHGPLYLALLVDVALAAGVLAALAWTALGDWLFSPLESLPPVAAAALYAALVVTLSTLVRTPLAFWRGWWREREWGFSTQGAGGWLGDRLKGLPRSVLLSAGGGGGGGAPPRGRPGAGGGAAGAARAGALRGWWAVPAGAALALAVLLLSFVARVALEPLFNRF